MNDIKGIIEDVEKSSLVSDKVIKKVIEIIGQEEWQDIHDDKSDICTTTGELIITLKGIPYLEQENEHLKQQNFIYYTEREYNNKIQKQLHEQIEKMKAEKGCETCTKFDEVKLAKATEIIKKLKALYFEPCVTHKDLENKDKLFEEAEQFIKDLEK